jgi:hypothetical protein
MDVALVGRVHVERDGAQPRVTGLLEDDRLRDMTQREAPELA